MYICGDVKWMKTEMFLVSCTCQHSMIVVILLSTKQSGLIKVEKQLHSAYDKLIQRYCTVLDFSTDSFELKLPVMYAVCSERTSRFETRQCIGLIF